MLMWSRGWCVLTNRFFVNALQRSSRDHGALVDDRENETCAKWTYISQNKHFQEHCCHRHDGPPTFSRRVFVTEEDTQATVESSSYVSLHVEGLRGKLPACCPGHMFNTGSASTAATKHAQQKGKAIMGCFINKMFSVQFRADEYARSTRSHRETFSFSGRLLSSAWKTNIKYQEMDPIAWSTTALDCVEK